MNQQAHKSHYRSLSISRRQAGGLLLGSLLFILLTVSQTGCLLTLDRANYVDRYNAYTCRATLVDTATGEVRMLASNDPMLNPLPGQPRREFFDFNWDGDGNRDVDDVLLDWRRYINNSILSSPNFTGRSWCIRPAETSCSMSGTTSLRAGTMPTALPDGTSPPVCAPPSEPRLEVTAPGLSTDNQLALADTPIGLASAPVTMTIANNSMVPLVINRADFLGAGDAADFEKLTAGDTCQPTPDEMTRGVGHTLNPAQVCSFTVRFRPQFRAGASECDRDSVNESCRRRATLEVTSQTADGRALTPTAVGTSGRAIGGRIAVDPSGEVCFATATPAIGDCTEVRTIRISNNGTRDTTGNLTLTFARLTRAGATFNAPSPFLMGTLTLEPGLFVDVTARFCNTANDLSDGEFTINSSAPLNPTVVVPLINPLNRRCP